MTDRHEFRTYDYGNFATTDAMDDELDPTAPTPDSE